MDNHTTNSSHLRTRHVLIGLLVVAGIYLVADHGEHFLPYLPFTFLLGCVAMHLFMHKHHGHSHDDNRRHEDIDNKKE